jgi:hypothetical protein
MNQVPMRNAAECITVVYNLSSCQHHMPVHNYVFT